MQRTKIWIILATCLILIGCIIFGGVMAMFNWDFSKLNTEKFTTTTHKISEDFDSISIKNDTADVILMPSDDGICKVICYEHQKKKYSVNVSDNTLKLIPVDTRKWYEHISFFSFENPKITLFLPKSQYNTFTAHQDTGNIQIPKDFKFNSLDINTSTGNVTNLASVTETVKIKASTGNIKTKDISAKNIDLSVSTGKVTAANIIADGDIKINVSTGKTDLTDIKCKNIISNGDTGSMSLKNVIADEKFSIKRSTGNVNFDGCDAAELFIETDTGYVKGSLLSSKVFITETDTGRVNVPKTTTGGRCEITTDTGDIKISVSK